MTFSRAMPLKVSRAAGAAGPAGFVSAWIIGGLATGGYSFVEDAISRLAAVHAPTRILMTAGMCAFGVGLPVYATTLRRALGNGPARAATLSGLATLGVAAFPLDVSKRVDVAHGAAATLAYLATSAMPALSVRPLQRRGMQGHARVSLAVAVVSAASLAATTIGPAHGLFQRLGLTTVDVWLLTGALGWTGRLASERSRPGPVRGAG